MSPSAQSDICRCLNKISAFLGQIVARAYTLPEERQPIMHELRFTMTRVLLEASIAGDGTDRIFGTASRETALLQQAENTLKWLKVHASWRMTSGLVLCCSEGKAESLYVLNSLRKWFVISIYIWAYV